MSDQLHEIDRPDAGPPKTIDLSPTWAACCRIHCEALLNSKAEASTHRSAVAEIVKAGAFVDRFNRHIAPRLRSIATLAEVSDNVSAEYLRDQMTLIEKEVEGIITTCKEPISE